VQAYGARCSQAKKPNFSQIEKMKTSPNDGMRVTYTAHRNGSKFFNRIQDPQIATLTAKVEQHLRNRKYSPVLLLGTGIGFLIGLLLIFTIEPAQAQFFNKTQTWLGGAIPGIDASLVALIFNVLRALFVIYLGIGLVKVIQSARNDDDWQQLARTPLILVVTVTMGDILAAVITGV